MFHPHRYLAQRSAFEMARSPLRDAAAPDEAGAFQHFEVFGDRRRGDRKRLRQFLDGQLPAGEARENGATRGICESCKCCTEIIRQCNSPHG